METATTTETEPRTIMLIDHYASTKKDREPRAYRHLTEAEIRALGAGDHVLVIDNNGREVVRVKVTGRIRTWKRDANRIEIPLKYGFYSTGCAVFGLTEALDRMVTEVI